MRITKVHLLGLAVALAGVGGEEAAADVSVATATTTPLETSASGDVSVTSAGTITVVANQTAITVDSNNDVANAGSLKSLNANNSTGILLEGGFSGSIVTNGTIALTEDYVAEDTDKDGDIDGPFALGTNRVGVLLQSGTFTGDLTTSGNINIEGENSAGIRLNGVLDGDLAASGAISVLGNNGVGVALLGGAAGGVTGDVTTGGAINTVGGGSIGLLVGAPIGGELSIAGSVSTTGYRVVSRPSQAVIDKLDADDLLQGGSAVDVRYSVADGVIIRGIGVEDDVDDDGDGVTEAAGDTNDDLAGSVLSFGGAAALSISPDATTPVNLVLGATASGFGLVNRGNISATGVYDNVATTAVRIAGRGGATVTTANGFLNDGVVATDAVEADATSVYIGLDATVPLLLNRNAIRARVFSEGADTAYGVYVATGANVAAINNTGAIAVQMNGEAGNATAIIDRSNTLATITNSGTIAAVVLPTDTDPTDAEIPVVTGISTALDVSTSTIAVTLNQIADTPFTDDDTVDDDKASRPTPTITGNIRFGSGADALNLLAGVIAGNIEFGAGADAMVIDNGATYAGRITDSDGALTINVADGTLGLSAGALNLTSATIGADGNLGVVIGASAAASTQITASGTVTFADGANISAVLPTGLPQTLSQIFLTANGGLVGAENVVGALSQGGPFLYNVSISTVDGDPNSLEANLALKSAAQLGLGENEALALNPILEGLRQNTAAGNALGSLQTQFDFQDAYEDLMPSFASASAELAATAIQQQQSASSNRLATMRLNAVRGKSIWAQEIGYGLTRDPGTTSGVEFRGHGFGFAIGMDAPLDNRALVGVAASFITSNVEEPGRPDGEISNTFGQLNAYAGTSVGPVDLDFVAGGGYGTMKSRRFIEIGDNFSALSSADWSAFEGHGAVRASMPLQMGWLTVTPQTALTYVVLQEDGYTESGAGVGLDYDVDSATSQRLWGDAAVQIGGQFGSEERGATVFAPHLLLGYRANLIDEGAERTFRLAGGNAFTLTDDGYGDGGPLAGFGLTATNGFSTFSIAYEGEYGDQLTRHSLNVGVRVRF